MKSLMTNGGVRPPATVTEGNGVEIRRLYLRGFRPETTGTEGNGVEIRRLYLPTVLLRR
jgi:hypothetical protein